MALNFPDFKLSVKNQYGEIGADSNLAMKIMPVSVVVLPDAYVG